jgi:hypothetical protein
MDEAARIRRSDESTASTLLRELGWDPDLVERQLSHDVGSDVARAYDKSTLFPLRRKMMQAWADYLDEIKSDERAAAGRRRTNHEPVPR